MQSQVEDEINQYRTKDQIEAQPVTWSVIEESLKKAVLTWFNKVYKRFKEMIDPMLKAYGNQDDEVMAQELQYYLNCNTCSKTVEYLRQSPNDELLIDLVIQATIGACYEAVGEELCDSLAAQGRKLIFDGFFDLFVTQDYICSYLMPLCGEELAYE